MEMTFLQTRVFLSDWKRLGLGDDELRQLELQIMQNPVREN